LISYNLTSCTQIKSDYTRGKTKGGGDLGKNSTRLLIVYHQDLWASYDNGENWQIFKEEYNGADTSIANVLAIDFNNHFYIIEGDQDVWKSEDGGVTFSKSSNNFNGVNGIAYGLVINDSGAIFAADAQADVWVSLNQGVNWSLVKDDYNGGTANNVDDLIIDSNNVLYILDKQDFWKSANNGVDWTLVNDDFNGVEDSEDGFVAYTEGSNFYLIDEGEDVFISTNAGIGFTKLVSDFNAGNTNVFGMSSITRLSTLTFEVRNCSQADCSDGVWQNANLENLELASQYFQYRINFFSPDSSITPLLQEININYSPIVYEVYVDDNFNSSTEGFGITHFSNISDAISIVQEGGKIHVAGGTYNEMLIISKSLALLGEGFETTVINGSKVGHVITIGSNNVNISGFKIVGSGTNWGNAGIYYSSGGYSIIENNYLSGNNAGISFSAASPGNIIRTNYIVDSSQWGIYTNMWATQNNLIYNNYFNNSDNLNAASAPPAFAAFNITKTLGANIIEGIYIGGNYWNDYFGMDVNGDGIGDTAYNVDGSYYDYLPLIDNSAPLLDLVLPQDLGKYNYNYSLILEFIARDSEENLESCWYNLNNGENITLVGCQNTTIDVPQGENIINIYANDSNGLQDSDSATFYVDSILPAFLIRIPENNANSTDAGLDIEYTYYDLNPGSCWWTQDSGIINTTIICGENITSEIWQEGENNILIYTNDSFGNVNSSSVKFFIDSISPELSLIKPGEGDSFGTNESLELQFSVSDAHLNSCWYNLNKGENVSMIDCLNTTFNVSGTGSYTLYLYANDSNGLSSGNSVNFSVDLGAPSISELFPNDIYFTSHEIVFSYKPFDIDLDSCELWGNFNGNWGLNQTNFNPENNTLNHFYLNLSDGNYLWNIKCNDSIGNFVFNGNKTFYVDTLKPIINLTEPIGTKNSRTEIPLTFLVEDNSSVMCFYNIYRGENIEKTNTTIVDCSSTTFSVTVDADFILNLYVNDSAGNLNGISSSFKVDTTPATPIIVSSGGGGSSRPRVVNNTIFNNTLIADLDLDLISSLVLGKGTSKEINLNVKNNGTSFLNDCVFISEGDYASWLSSNIKKNIAAGEETLFNFKINVPETIGPGIYSMGYGVICKEIIKKEFFLIEILEQEVKFELIEIQRLSNEEVKIIYSLEEISGKEQNIELQFLMVGSNEEKASEVKTTIVLSANSKKEFEVLMPIDSFLEGDLNLLVNLNSKTYSAFVQEDLVLGAPISGFFLFGEAGIGENLISLGLILTFLVFSFFIIRRIFSHRKTIRKKFDNKKIVHKEKWEKRRKECLAKKKRSKK
jgi:hypothetical protein